MWLKLPLMSCLPHISINGSVVDLAQCVVYIQSIKSVSVNLWLLLCLLVKSVERLYVYAYSSMVRNPNPNLNRNPNDCITLFTIITKKIHTNWKIIEIEIFSTNWLKLKLNSNFVIKLSLLSNTILMAYSVDAVCSVVISSQVLPLAGPYFIGLFGGFLWAWLG